MNYLPRDKTVEILSEVGISAGMETNANHPEDILIAMITAMEGAAKALEVLAKQ